MTSPSTAGPARWAAQAVMSGRSAPPGWPPSARCAAPAPCASSAPRPRPAARSSCTTMTPCCVRPVATGPPIQPCERPTASIGRMWNGSSPSSPAVAAAACGCATWVLPPTTPGSSAVPPPSTCATSSAVASPAAMAPGRWPPPEAHSGWAVGSPPKVCTRAANRQPTTPTRAAGTSSFPTPRVPKASCRYPESA
jgi:hypothetical protein